MQYVLGWVLRLPYHPLLPDLESTVSSEISSETVSGPILTLPWNDSCGAEATGEIALRDAR